MSEDTTGGIHQKIGLFLGPVAFLLVWNFANLDPGNVMITRMAAIAAWMSIWWITDAIPHAVTALLPVVLFPLFGIMSGKDVAPKYFDDIIFLYIGGFLVAIAMQNWNLHKRIALRTLMIFGMRPPMILLGFLVSTGFISMWISNTATAMMMMPIAIAVVLNLDSLVGEREMGRFPTAIFLSIAYASSIGGIGTLVGTPPNLVLVGVYAKQFPDATPIGFAQWMAFAAPLAIILTLAAWFLLYKMYPPRRSSFNLSPELFREKYRELGPMSFEERCILTVFVSVAVLWITRSSIDFGSVRFPGWAEALPYPKLVTDGTVSVLAALALFLIPVKSETSTHILDGRAISKIPWDIVLLFGGGFALAEGIQMSGLSVWIGERIKDHADFPPIVLVLIVCTVLTFLTEVTSNTATATVFLPVLGAAAVELGVDPLLLMVPATISASLGFMLPVGTPPNAIAYSSGRISMGQMVKAGFFLNLLGIVLVTLSMWTLGRLVLGIKF